MPDEPNTKEPNAESSNDQRPKPYKDADPAAALAADLLRLKAVELRLEGKSFQAIAKALNISKETAWRWVEESWDRVNDMTDEAKARLRDQAEARLDKALGIILPLLEAENLVTVSTDGKGNEVRQDAAELKLKAIDRLVKVVAEQAKLRGLHAPQKLEVSTPKRTLIPVSALKERIAQAKANQARATGGQGPLPPA